MSAKPLSIAILGTRGIPARYGGFETFAEELSVSLVERGHKVTVYARHRLGDPAPIELNYRGVTVRSAPTILHKYLETPLHALSSNLDLFTRSFDVALLCNAANAPFAWMIRLKGLPLLINVDGIERMRSKWSSIGKLWYCLGERAATWFASRVISDAEVIADYYKTTYGIDSTVIPYGARAVVLAAGDTLNRFNLTPKRYILYVSRLEPENNALGVIEAYGLSNTELPLVIVGDAPYATRYKEVLQDLAKQVSLRDPKKRVIFCGFQFGEAYQELQSHAALYIQATEVGGTHPALIEAMAYGNAVIANGTPENIEVLADTGLIYSKNNFKELSQLIDKVLLDPALIEDLKGRAKARANLKYTWSAVTDQYERLFFELTGRY